MEYTPDNTTQKIRNHFQIATKYIKGRFFLHLLCLIPFNLIFMLKDVEDKPNLKFFFLIKILRLYEGMEIFNESEIKTYVKQLLAIRLKRIIEHKPHLANDQTSDNSKISALIIIKHVIKTIKMLILILTLSYFIGIFWLMLCELEYKYATEEEKSYQDYFVTYFD